MGFQMRQGPTVSPSVVGPLSSAPVRLCLVVCVICLLPNTACSPPVDHQSRAVSQALNSRTDGGLISLEKWTDREVSARLRNSVGLKATPISRPWLRLTWAGFGAGEASVVAYRNADGDVWFAEVVRTKRRSPGAPVEVDLETFRLTHSERALLERVYSGSISIPAGNSAMYECTKIRWAAAEFDDGRRIERHCALEGAFNELSEALRVPELVSDRHQRP
jgi:hypothetical protein